MPDRGAAHRQLVHDVRLALGEYRDVVIWVNANIPLRSEGKLYHAGLCKGAADLIGVGPGGRFLAVEIKTGSGKLSEQQRRFGDLVHVMGGIFVEARCVADATRAVEEARRGRHSS